MGGRRRPLQTVDGAVHCGLRKERCVLADGGQLDVAEACKLTVVVAKDGHVFRHAKASSPEALPDAQGAAVVESHDGGGQLLLQLPSGAQTVFFRGATRDYAVIQSAALHFFPEGRPALRTGDGLTAVNVGYAAVAQRGQVLDREVHAGPVVAAHGVHGVPNVVPEQADYRHPGRVFGQLLFFEGRGNHDQGFASEIQQRVRRTFFGPSVGHRTERDIVAPQCGSGVGGINDFGVKSMGSGETDAKEPRAAASEEAGTTVRPVAKCPGSFLHFCPGGVRCAWNIPHDDGNEGA
ncbi:hypothetical protein PJL18_03933 [Paenarthrobacter nicotinovorans]|nr:hypothetical protein [Paenarthrobacter nicotinovorans]